MNWWDSPPAYSEQILHAIGIALAIAAILVCAWILRLFTYAENQYGDWGPADTKPPFWVYVGAAALFFGLVGAFSTRFNPVFLIMTCIGLVIVVIFWATR
jgi:hypothetical protein